LDELNEPQRAAVEYIDGPALVIAGAGSGKTRVLTYKIMHLLENGYKPWNILAITFTNKAAREMKERIAKKIGEEKAASLWMGTFHSVFLKILRMEIDKTEYQKNFTIYDAEDAKKLVKNIVKDLNLDDKKYPVNEVYNRITTSKNGLITAEEYEASPYYADDCNAHKPLIAKIYKLYVKKCKSANAMDFDDLLLQTQILFRNNPDVVKKYADKFRYILVDEYQDTNSVQYNIVKALAMVHRHVFVVGDDAQSIYSFRGAQIENILNFKRDYKEAQIFKLEQNYRSTQTIVNAANTVIACNSRQMKKNSFSENETGEKIRVMENQADNEEGFNIAADILKKIERRQADGFADFAILYRTNAQSRILEESLMKRSIPYKIYGGMSFYQRKEVKDLISYLRLAVNGNDDEAFLRVVNYPKRGIGDTTMSKISQIATTNGLSVWNTVAKIKEFEPSISPRTINALAAFMKMIFGFHSFATTADAYQTAMKIASESGILADLKADKTVEGQSRYENIEELLNGIKSMGEDYQKKENAPMTLAQYLDDVSLMTDADEDKGDSNKVSLLTIHSAKGLEFKNVYLAGVEEGLFPSAKSVMSEKDLEEERRLFYVAVTRAQKKLTVSFARMRYKWGQLTPAAPSRFIKEIDSRYLDYGIGGESMFMASDQPFAMKRHPNSLNKMAEENRLKKLSSFRFSSAGNSSADEDKYKEGVEIVHNKFGRGQISAVSESPNGKQIVVNFMSVGRKVLLLKYTLPNLKILEN
jgi:DNA helicase-2/ATP-dependent DNA helicase PcrA